jgi:hypothetical protein
MTTKRKREKKMGQNRRVVGREREEKKIRRMENLEK